MTTIRGTLFSGRNLVATPVELTVTPGRLASVEPSRAVDVSLADVTVSDRLANVPRFLYLPDNRTIETPDNAAVDELLLHQSQGGMARAIHFLESRARIAAAATVLLVAAAAAGLWWGLPVAARKAAMAVPDSIEERAGRAGEAAFARFLGPSALTAAQRARVERLLAPLLEAGRIPAKPRLVFHSMGSDAPNAFALPGGVIIVSDELVRLAGEQNGELSAVLAHEIAHWRRRHGLQSVFRNSTALLLVSTLTGDLSTLTTFAGNLPFVLLQRGYSREFEAEADADAIALLRRAGIPLFHFAAILRKLEAARPKQGADFTYLSTHPGTADRIRTINAAGGRVAAETRPPEPPVSQLQVEPSLELQPRAIRRPAPVYPADLRARAISGSVRLQFIVDEKGDVQDVTVLESSDAGFDDAAIAAVSAWKFEPGRKHGRAVRVRAFQLLEFNATE